MEQQGYYQAEDTLITIGATGIQAQPTLIPHQPIEVYRLVFIADDVIDAAVIAVTRVDADDTGSKEVLESVTIPALAQGKGAFKLFNRPYIVLPGQQIFLEVTTAAAGVGDGFAGLHYRPIGFTTAGAVKHGPQSAFPPAAIGGPDAPFPFDDPRTIANRLVNMTELLPT